MPFPRPVSARSLFGAQRLSRRGQIFSTGTKGTTIGLYSERGEKNEDGGHTEARADSV